MRSITTRCADPRVRRAALAAYFLAVEAGLLYLAARRAFASRGFIYQAF